MAFRVDPESAVPPSRQLVDALLDRVAAGVLRAGDRLPSVRSMAAEALVNPNTVAKAYRELEALGCVLGRSGSGVFVTEDGPRLAREERRGTTLAALDEALRQALRAGHRPDQIERRLARRLAKEESIR